VKKVERALGEKRRYGWTKGVREGWLEGEKDEVGVRRGEEGAAMGWKMDQGEDLGWCEVTVAANVYAYVFLGTAGVS
jgi:hypothetical protein